MLYDANDDSKIMVLDLEKGDFVLRHEVYNSDGKKEYKIALVPGKKYLALDIAVKGNERKMTNKEIADCYFEGISGFPHDILKAMEYYELDGSGESLFMIAQLFLENDDYKDEDAGIEYMIQAAKKECFDAVQYLSNYYYQTKNYNEAIQYDKQLVEISKAKAQRSQSDVDMVDWAVHSFNCAIALIYAKKYEDAESNLLNALHIYKKVYNKRYSQNIADVYFWLSELYFEQGEYIRPGKYLLKAIEFYEECSNSYVKCALSGRASSRMSEITGKEGDIIQQLLNYSQGDIDASILSKLGNCFNNLAYSYKNMGQYSEAEGAYIEAYKIRKNLANKSSEQYGLKFKLACEKLISFYELTGQADLKNKYIDELTTFENLYKGE